MEAPLPRFSRRTPSASAKPPAPLPAPVHDPPQPPPSKRPRLSARGVPPASASGRPSSALLQRIRDSLQTIDALPQHPPRLRHPSVSGTSSTSSYPGARLRASRSTSRSQPSTKPAAALDDARGRPRPVKPPPSPASSATSRGRAARPPRQPDDHCQGHSETRTSRWDQPLKPADAAHGHRHPPPAASGTSLAGGKSGDCVSPVPGRSSPTQTVGRGTSGWSSSISPSLASLASTTGSSFGSSSPRSSKHAPRWTSKASCDAEYSIYRDVAHKLKKRADDIVSSGRRQEQELEAAQVMWTDSLLLYAYASWARDQGLRFDPAAAASPASERGETHEMRLPLALDRSPSQRGMQDWLELQPLLEHVTKQLRKTPTEQVMVVKAVLQTLQARILLLSAAHRQGSASRKLKMLAQHCSSETDTPASTAEDLRAFAAEVASALRETDRAWSRENQARAWLNPQVLQDQFPHTRSALAVLPEERQALADRTLGLDPSSVSSLESNGFVPDRPAPAFPLPDGPDALAHLIVLGRMLVAEMVQRRRIDYDPVSVPP